MSYRGAGHGRDQLPVVKLYSLTLPGLDVRSDWRAVHDRLLDDFPAIDDVLPTTTMATILIVYEGAARNDGWFDRVKAYRQKYPDLADQVERLQKRRLPEGWDRNGGDGPCPVCTSGRRVARRSHTVALTAFWEVGFRC